MEDWDSFVGRIAYECISLIMVSGNAMLPLMLHFSRFDREKSPIERNVVDFLNYSPVVGMLLLLVE